MDYIKKQCKLEHGKKFDKRQQKRHELALHTLSTLAELGFARINLRDIATRSGVSLGVIHYYFTDKTDLLIYCVRLYKEDFVRQLNSVIKSASNANELIQQFCTALALAIAKHGQVHRLWYDLRGQALFDPAFQPVVDEIETQLISLIHSFGVKLKTFDGSHLDDSRHAGDELSAYLAVDSWFRYYLQQHLAGDISACTAFKQRLKQIIQAS